MKERFDVAIGILDHTENEIERIKNQHKFEKDLSEFLKTNAYSKDKYWVAGMLNQVSEYCKDKIDTLIEKDQRIAELEKQLKDLQEKEKVISREFAIEQLEKVKEWVINYSDLKGQNWNHTLNYLNNQIKQLNEWE